MNKQTNIHFLLVYMKLTSLNCIKNKKPKYLLSLTGNLRNERKMWVTSDVQSVRDLRKEKEVTNVSLSQIIPEHLMGY